MGCMRSLSFAGPTVESKADLHGYHQLLEIDDQRDPYNMSNQIVK